MARIRRTFQGGKMNKDLDERLIPQGEYRDALNVEITTSDGSSVGVVKPISGNVKIPTSHSKLDSIGSGISSELIHSGGDAFPGKVIGNVSDNKTNSSYFFITAPSSEYWSGEFNADAIEEPVIGRDLIVRYDSVVKKIFPVFTDIFYVELPANHFQDISNKFNTVSASASEVTNLESLRAGMIVQAIDENGNNLLQAFDVYDGSSSDVKIISIFNNTLNLDKYLNHKLANGDLLASRVVKWRFIHPEPVLQFAEGIKEDLDYRISSANIIGDLLFWTDGRSEPKRVNIDRLINGTGDNMPQYHKHSLNLFRDPHSDNPNSLVTLSEIEDPNSVHSLVDNKIKREHITVIKKSPTTSPKLIMSNSSTSINGVDTRATSTFDFSGVQEQDTIPSIYISNDFVEGSVLIFTPITNKYVSVRAVVTSNISGGIHSLSIESISEELNFATSGQYLEYDVQLVQSDSIFKDKIGRFAYRYKYYDGECSVFSPWSELAFLPGKYDYTAKRGYNLGMQNNLRNLTIVDFVNEYAARPDDVKEIDILFKDTSSPNVYIVKTIKRNKNFEWHNTLSVSSGHKGSGGKGVVSITTDMIHRTLESSQILRSWDNVPKTAKAQEVTGNRIVYGNYEQGYDILSDVIVDTSLITTPHPSIEDESQALSPYRSIKSMRKYKLGVVFGDEYGRETPVVGVGGVFNTFQVDGETSESTLSPENYVNESFEVKKDKSINVNKIKAKVKWKSGNAPEAWMDYYKFYIKETSNEYYNLVMDKWYDNEDGTLWISFSSADRNKIDEQTYLILKKSHKTGDAVLSEDAKYKVLAIKSEAPQTIKTTHKTIAVAPMDSLVGGIALSQSMSAVASDGNWMSSGLGPYSTGLKKFEGVAWARIKGESIGATPSSILYSDWVRVSNITEAGVITVAEPWGTTADMNSDYGFGASASVDYFIEVKDLVIEDKPEFNGKFFVKIFKDSLLEEQVTIPGSNDDLVYTVSHSTSLRHICTSNTLPNAQQNPADGSASYKGDYSTVNIPEPNNGVNDHTDYMWNLSGFTSGNNNVPLQYTHMGDSEMACMEISPMYQTGTAYESYDYNVLRDFWVEARGSSAYGNGWFIDNAGYAYETFNGVSMGSKRGLFSLPPTDLIILSNDGWTLSGLDNNIDSIDVVSPSGKNAIQLSNLNVGNLDSNMQEFMDSIRTIGQRFRFKADPGLNGEPIVYEVMGYSPIEYPLKNYRGRDGFDTNFDGSCEACWPGSGNMCYRKTFTILFRQVNNAYVGLDTSIWDPRSAVKHDGSSSLEVELVNITDVSQYTPSNNNGGNAIWETEPKEDVGLDLYYEVSDAIPMKLKEDTIENYIPLYSKVKPFSIIEGSGGVYEQVYDNYLNVDGGDAFVNTLSRDVIGIGREIGEVEPIPLTVGNKLKFERPDGTMTEGIVKDHWLPTVAASNASDAPYRPAESYYDVPVYVMEPQDANNPQGGSVKIFLAQGGAMLDKLQQTVNTSGSQRSIWRMEIANSYNGNVSIEANLYVTGMQFDASEEAFELETTHVFPNSLNESGADWYSAWGWQENIGEYNPAGMNVPHHFIVNLHRITGYYRLDDSLHTNSITLPWFNCYSFGNGLESNRIRDDYNAPYINNGVKVSTTLDSYGKEIRTNGLIHSGIYNSTSGINDLNQFNMAEPITKDINPSYGPIMALKSRDTNLITFCEDKVLKILANKDALYNADGSSNITSSNVILGNSIAYAGDYGISNTPESLAVDGYRMYFVDNHRNKVLRLSQDGLTVISDIGMKDWFRDNLVDSKKIIGSFDEVKGDYNISIIHSNSYYNKTISFNERNKGWTSFKSWVQESGCSINSDYLTAYDGYIWLHHVTNTIPAYMGDASTGYSRPAIIAPNHCEFYDLDPVESSINVVFNEQPNIIKNFVAMDYEGSQAYIEKFAEEAVVVDVNGNNVSYNNLNSWVSDGEYYNLNSRAGWRVDSISTDLGKGNVIDFREKEGKWFSNITGDGDAVASIPMFGDVVLDSSNLQGVGMVRSMSTPPVLGCMDSCADNYNAYANTSDGTCIYTKVYGCTDASYQNYNELATVNQVSCEDTSDPCGELHTFGCNPNASNATYPFSEVINANPSATLDDSSCIQKVIGCMDPLYSNYNENANSPGECIDDNIYGCMDDSYQEYNPNATVNQVNINDNITNPCVNLHVIGCNILLGDYPFTDAVNHIPSNTVDDGSCIQWIDGCTDPNANNYNVNANVSDGSCTYDVLGCMDPDATNYNVDATINALYVDNGYYSGNACVYQGCYDTNAANYMDKGDVSLSVSHEQEDGTFVQYSPRFDDQCDSCCEYLVYGCTDPTADNYNPNADTDDGSCTYPPLPNKLIYIDEI